MVKESRTRRNIRSIAGFCTLALVIVVTAADASADFQYRFKVPGVSATASDGGESTSPVSSGPSASCEDILVADPSAASGVHEIEIDGVAFDVWCDMESAGGGWTMVAALYENGQVFGWDDGRTTNYDPTLASGSTFTLAQEELPVHSETAFGKDHDATFVDYVDFQYTTGDLYANEIQGKKTGALFDIYRSSNDYMPGCDEDTYLSPLTSSPGWHDMLCFNPTPNGPYGNLGAGMAWAFGAKRGSVTESGFHMKGADRSYHRTFAWTVWVR